MTTCCTVIFISICLNYHPLKYLLDHPVYLNRLLIFVNFWERINWVDDTVIVYTALPQINESITFQYNDRLVKSKVSHDYFWQTMFLSVMSYTNNPPTLLCVEVNNSDHILKINYMHGLKYFALIIDSHLSWYYHIELRL